MVAAGAWVTAVAWVLFLTEGRREKEGEREGRKERGRKGGRERERTFPKLL